MLHFVAIEKLCHRVEWNMGVCRPEPPFHFLMRPQLGTLWASIFKNQCLKDILNFNNTLFDPDLFLGIYLAGRYVFINMDIGDIKQNYIKEFALQQYFIVANNPTKKHSP